MLYNSFYISVENPALPVSDFLADFVSYSTPDTMGFDDVFMINLVRRPERRKRMIDCFKELGIQATLVNAVDGRYVAFIFNLVKSN